jgi:hypothetical protein
MFQNLKFLPGTLSNSKIQLFCQAYRELHNEHIQKDVISFVNKYYTLKAINFTVLPRDSFTLKNFVYQQALHQRH